MYHVFKLKIILGGNKMKNLIKTFHNEWRKTFMKLKYDEEMRIEIVVERRNNLIFKDHYVVTKNKENYLDALNKYASYKKGEEEKFDLLSVEGSIKKIQHLEEAINNTLRDDKIISFKVYDKNGALTYRYEKN